MVNHNSFVLTRQVRASVATAYKTWSDVNLKSQWFVGPHGRWTLLERCFDFRVGGKETCKGGFAEGGCEIAPFCSLRELDINSVGEAFISGHGWMPISWSLLTLLVLSDSLGQGGANACHYPHFLDCKICAKMERNFVP